MIKKIHYVQLTALILLLFVIFQITSISISFQSSKKGADFSASDQVGRKDPATADYLIITGNQSSTTANIEKELEYLKLNYRTSNSLWSIPEDELDQFKVIILAADSMKAAYDLDLVKSCMMKGVNLIFAELQVSELDEDWKDFLGIASLKDTVSQTGIVVFSGFFIGEKHYFDQLRVNAADIKVKNTCKTFIAGYRDENHSDKEQMQDIVWRNIYDKSQMYVINGSFLTNGSGYGILTGILSQMYENFIYPVINARALIINNSPYLTMEAKAGLESRYARTPERFFEDLVIPNLVSLCLTTQNVPTFYGLTSFDAGAPDTADLNTSILKVLQVELHRIGGELGISSYDKSNAVANDKVKAAVKLYQSSLNQYECKTLNLGAAGSDKYTALLTLPEMSSITTCIAKHGSGYNFDLFRNNLMILPVTSKGFYYNDEEYFQLQSMATALGVITHELDMKDIIFTDNDRMDWSTAFANFTSMINGDNWRSYRKFDEMTVTETGKRVARFLSLEPQITDSGNKLLISIDGFDTEAYFILRTQKRIKQVKNGTYEKLQEGAYLIRSGSDKLEILLH